MGAQNLCAYLLLLLGWLSTISFTSPVHDFASPVGGFTELDKRGPKITCGEGQRDGNFYAFRPNYEFIPNDSCWHLKLCPDYNTVANFKDWPTSPFKIQVCRPQKLTNNITTFLSGNAINDAVHAIGAECGRSFGPGTFTGGALRQANCQAHHKIPNSPSCSPGCHGTSFNTGFKVRWINYNDS